MKILINKFQFVGMIKARADQRSALKIWGAVGNEKTKFSCIVVHHVLLKSALMKLTDIPYF